MYSKALNEHRHTIAFRLTLWYAGVFAFSSIAAFAVAYFVLVSVVQQRTDEDLLEDLEEFAQLFATGGLERVTEEMNIDTGGDEASQVFFRLWTADGEPLLSTDLSDWDGLPAPHRLAAESRFEAVVLPGREHGVQSAIGPIGPNLVLQVGESLEANEELIDAVRNGFLLTLASVILLGGPIGWFMARRALRGVREVTHIANEIADGDLDQRVMVGSRGDELDALGESFNKMLDRIQALIVGMREMTDNLAHDFRSPLARIRASAEMSLTSGEHGDYECMAANTAEECDRLLEMINTTLDIAEAESGAAKLVPSDLDMVALVRDAIELFQPVAEDKGVTVSSDLPDYCPIRADLQRLQRVVANLIDNALKYTPAGGRVDVKLVARNGEIEFRVEDNGLGMSALECARIFERFYRCDSSRSERGNGLGLSLALAFVRAHNGSIAVKSAPGEGSRFTAVLPRLQGH
jgi:signal transduction histidine kinase